MLGEACDDVKNACTDAFGVNPPARTLSTGEGSGCSNVPPPLPEIPSTDKTVSPWVGRLGGRYRGVGSRTVAINRRGLGSVGTKTLEDVRGDVPDIGVGAALG